MSTTKAKKEIKLKARITSLSKKTNEELIAIILRKDNTERKNNSKIMSLKKSIHELEVQNTNLIKDCTGTQQTNVDLRLEIEELKELNKNLQNKVYVYSENIHKLQSQFNKYAVISKWLKRFHII